MTTKLQPAFSLCLLIVLVLSCGEADEPNAGEECLLLAEAPSIPGWRSDEIVSSYGSSKSKYHFVDRNVGFALAATLLRTTNGGEDWVEVDNFPDAQVSTLREVSAVNDQMLAVVANGPEDQAESKQLLMFSHDGGENWETIETDEYLLAKISFKDASMGFAYGFEKASFQVGLLRTNDGGATWTPVEGTGFTSAYSDLRIEWKDSNVGLAQTGIDHAYLTTDGGANWEQITSGQTGLNVYYAASSSLILSTVSNLTYVSFDGGETWALSQPDSIFPFTFQGQSGLGVLTNPDCDNAQPGNVAFATTTDGGATWTPTSMVPSLSFADRQEVAPGLFVFQDPQTDTFHWFESN